VRREKSAAEIAGTTKEAEARMKKFAVGEVVMWWDSTDFRRYGVVQHGCVDEGSLTVTEVSGETHVLSEDVVLSAATASEPVPEVTATQAPVVSQFRAGDLVWVRHYDRVSRSVFRAWTAQGDAALDGVVVPRAEVDDHVALRFREYQLDEYVEWNKGDGTWLPAVIIQDSPWMLGLRVRGTSGKVFVWIEDSACRVRRAVLKQEDAAALESATDDLLVPKISMPLNARAGEVTDGSYVVIDGIDGELEAIVMGRDEHGVRVILRGGDHVVVPEHETVHDYHRAQAVFTCVVGCPSRVPTMNKIRISDDGPVYPVSRLVPLERATHADVYRCTKCGGMWHRDDLVRRRGQALLKEWAKRREVGTCLKMKLAKTGREAAKRANFATEPVTLLEKLVANFGPSRDEAEALKSHYKESK
jgi:hypothetical protein